MRKNGGDTDLLPKNWTSFISRREKIAKLQRRISDGL